MENFIGTGSLLAGPVATALLPFQVSSRLGTASCWRRTEEGDGVCKQKQLSEVVWMGALFLVAN